MRLGTCIVVELLVGASTLAALGAGSAYGLAELQAYLDEPAAVVAAAEPAPAPLVLAKPVAAPEPASVAVAVPAAAVISVAPPPAVDPELADELGRFPEPVGPGLPAWSRAGLDDDDALAPLRAGAVTRVKLNRGGSSLSLRLDFDNGARAAFKPEQIHPQSTPRREIAAYRIDRLLGINRVPPAVGRTFSMEELLAAIPPKERARHRLTEEATPRKGRLRGELSWWVPVLEEGKVSGFAIDDVDGIVTWKRYLRAGATVPAEDLTLVRQISDMIAFDFLLDNVDRWSGNNAKISEDGTILYFMDNTMALSVNGKGHRKSHIYLSRVETFSRRLIERIRALTKDEVKAAVADDTDPFDYLMTDREIEALMKRRDKLLEYVDTLIAEHGEEKVLAFP